MPPLRPALKASPAVCRQRAVCFRLSPYFQGHSRRSVRSDARAHSHCLPQTTAARCAQAARLRHATGASGEPASSRAHRMGPGPGRGGGGGRERGAGFVGGATHGAVAGAAADAGGGNTAPVRQRQNGATVLKNRPSQPMAWASVRAPRPRDSTRTLATRVEAMMLPGCNALGSTVPEKRSTSTFWFTPICFSPVTTRWPLGSTSTTVVVMAPEKVLALSVPPLPEKVLSALVPRDSLPVRVLPMNGRACTPADTCDWRSTVEED